MALYKADDGSMFKDPGVAEDYLTLKNLEQTVRDYMEQCENEFQSDYYLLVDFCKWNHKLDEEYINRQKITVISGEDK